MIICNTGVSGGGYEILISTKANATITAVGPETVTTQADGSGHATMKFKRDGSYTVHGELDGDMTEEHSITVPLTVEVLDFPPPLDPVLANNTPEQILRAAKSGKAKTIWNVGDTIPIHVNFDFQNIPESEYYACIIGFDHNKGIEGNNTIHFQFGKTSSDVDYAFCGASYDIGVPNDSADNIFIMNKGPKSNFVGWSGCYMRNTVCSKFFDSLPEEWKNVISPCKKYTDNVGKKQNKRENVTYTEDKIWLLSEPEVFGSDAGCSTSGFCNDYEKEYAEQYEYYANGHGKIRQMYNSGTAKPWWLRSVSMKPNREENNFCRVIATGTSDYIASNYMLCFSPCFKVGGTD